MILDAHTMTAWQACKRRYELEREWRVIKWRPKYLFDALLRRAIFSLSKGGDAATLADEARTQFLSTAANPGLDLPPGANPYAIAKSWCGMFDTILRVLGTTSLMTVREARPVALTNSVEWFPRAWVDDTGSLHRWLTIDAWGEDDLSREMHSWYTVGDIAAMRASMTLHVIEIGRVTKDGRSTPWTRAWVHPSMRLKYRFRKPTGGDLGSGWQAYHYNDSRDDPDEWAERMVSEGEHERVVHHLLANAPTDAQCAEAMRQAVVESLAMREQSDEDRLWHTLPMSRNACDSFVPCPFQYACYSPDVVPLETLGLYQRREPATVAPMAVVKEGR